MANLLEKIRNLNDLVLQGNAMDTFEKYYHQYVSMQENENPPTLGKENYREREKEIVPQSWNLEVQNP